jgi:dephospho-CoA kinase
VYCVGLTGTIASGKSTVAAGFKNLGIDVISADQISRELTAKNQPALQKIVAYFGDEVLTSNGELNRRYLRQLIFDQTDHRQWLEKLLHPLIRKQIQHDIHRCSTPYCLIEIPLLFNKKQYSYLNRILLVLTAQDQQMLRLLARDNCSKQQALAILATQAKEETLRNLADDVLFNNGTIEKLNTEILALHEQYLQFASINTF